jgi:pentatricopeptide repeat protein
MSLFRTLDRTSAVSRPPPARPWLAFLYPVWYHSAPQRRFSKTAINRPPRTRAANGGAVGTLFIQALARAASCPEHARHLSTQRDGPALATPHHKKRRKSVGAIVRRPYTSARPASKGPFRIVKTFAEKELKALVDYYDIDTQPPPREADAIDDDDGGSLVWNVGDKHERWPPKEPKDARLVERLQSLLKLEEPSHEEIWETYTQLSEPRVVYLPDKTIHDMLHHLSIVERPTLGAMQPYLSILDDMKNAHIHIRRQEWTTATHLAGRHRGFVSADDLQSALYLWRDMEQRANVKAGHVTFNVLFAIAVKAGKFTLAELFLEEMKARRLKFHRHFRISLLYYHGVMQNGSGVRRVYQDMIAAGDVVDVVVMNAVIAALFRAGEPSAAEHVFERMKRLAATGRATGRTSLTIPGGSTLSKSDRTWRGQRKLGLQLTYGGRDLARDGDTEGLKQLQEWAPIAPNSRTYSLLIRHQATVTGNIDRVNELLREMGYNGVPLEGSIFVVIFHGFTAFGGVRYSSWTRAKLEQTWTEYMQAVSDGLYRTWIGQTSVVAVLKAFRKCADAERTMQVWEEIKKVWDPSAEEREGVLKTLRPVVQPKGFFDGPREL